MRYFYWENAGFPLKAGARRYTFQVTARVAGTIQGVLAIENADEASQFIAAAARAGVTEITQQAYENELQKKKGPLKLGGLKPNYDPEVERRSTRTAAKAAEVAAGLAGVDTQSSMMGKVGVRRDDPSAEPTRPDAPAGVPRADELFPEGKLAFDIVSGKTEVREVAAPKRGPRRPGKAVE